MDQPKILGVCYWLSDVLGVEAKVLRIIFIIAVLFFGVSIGLYFILFLIKLIVD